MKIVKNTLLFIMVFLVCDRAMYISIVNLEGYMYSENEYFQVLGNYLKKKRYDTLILGTSRTYDAIHPVYIMSSFRRRAYREASHGKGAKYNYYFYKEYKKLAGIPEVVVYGVDYFIFNTDSNERWLSRFNLTVRDDSVLSDFSMLLSRKDKVDRTLNNGIDELKKVLLGKRRGITPSMAIKISQRYTGLPSNGAGLIKKRPRRMKYASYIRYPGREGEYFDMLLKELNEDGVKVMLVLLPDYIGTYRTNNQKRSCVIDLRKFTDKYKNVKLYNYNMPEVFPIERNEFFRDGGYGNPNSHLSSAGARYLNKNLFLKDLGALYD